MLWHGSIESIPSGWHECDGTMGTPDLRELFVRAAHPALPPGTKGGASNHTHDFTGNSHSHTIPEGTGLAAGTDRSYETESDPAVGTTNYGPNEPKYYCLAYIMKL